MQATVREAMSTDVVSVNCHVSIADAERMLLKYRLDELFVSDDRGMLCGVVPDYALLKQRMGDVASTVQPVEAIMSRRFLVITPDSPLIVAGRYLREHVHRRLAVVENMRLIGQVTRCAVLSLMASLDADADPVDGGTANGDASRRFDETQPALRAPGGRPRPAEETSRPQASAIDG